MSSLRDDVDSRAYAAEGRYWRDRTLEDGLLDASGECVICRTDCVEIDWACRCAACAPRGEETSEEWERRVALRRERA